MPPFERALQLYGAREYKQALESLQTEARTTSRYTRDPLYQRLVDEICMHSAATGQVIGFDGRLLQVFPANPDAVWLGVTQTPRHPGPGASVLHFGSIHEALDAAEDGDVLQLLPGTHIVSQAVLQVSRRVLITAPPGATPQQVVLDHRANHPAFHIDRSCILRGFTIDMVGFTECVLVSGTSTTVKPILQDLAILCSGDDGVSVCNKAQPLIRGCEIKARFCGLTQNDSASTTLWQCTIAGGKHGLVAAGSSQTFFEGCVLSGCGQEGVLGLQQARVTMTDTKVCGCGGPGVDMSDDSSLVLKQVDVLDCQGGIWLWHKASCEAICSHISGGPTYAVLLDAEAYARGSSCSIDGPCHVQCMPGEQEEDGGAYAEDDDDGEEEGVRAQGGAAAADGASTNSHPLRARRAAGAPAAAVAGGAAAAGMLLPLGGRQGGLSRQAVKAAAAQAAASRVPAAAAAAAALGVFSPAAHGGAGGSPVGGGPASPFGSSNGSSQACLTELDYGDDAIVHPSMLVRDHAAAAALFPPEQGAFAAPQAPAYAHY